MAWSQEQASWAELYGQYPEFLHKDDGSLFYEKLFEFVGGDEAIEKKFAIKETKSEKKDFWALPWYIKWPILIAFLGLLAMFFFWELHSEQKASAANSPDS